MASVRHFCDGCEYAEIAWMVPEIGIVTVIQIYPSGAWAVRDCQGQVWLLDRDLVTSMVNRRRADAEKR